MTLPLPALSLALLALAGCGAPEATPEAPATAAASTPQPLRGAPLECGGSKPISCGVTCERTSCGKCCEVHDTCETACSVGGYASCRCVN